MTESIPVWWFDDGKAGHTRQTQALLHALDARLNISATRLSPWGWGERVWARLGLKHTVPLPQLLMGAGHGTHASLRALRSATGAPAVVLMKPSGPLGSFDLCAIPRHDNPPERDNVVVTEGPLSPLQPADERDEAGLILIGGPSKHYQFDSDYVWVQIRDLIFTQPDRHWLLSTSRRTPKDFFRQTPSGLGERIRLHDIAALPENWLENRLPKAVCCVVTPDSMSMIFDALSCGVPCALLDLKAERDSRITRRIASLLEQRQVERVGAYLAGRALPLVAPIQDADLVARAIVERWFR